MAARLQAKVRDRGLGQRPRLYIGSVCDDSAAEVAYAAFVTLYKWTLPLPFANQNATTGGDEKYGAGRLREIRLNSRLFDSVSSARVERPYDVV